MSTDLFDLLTGKTLDQITQTQFNSALDATYADRDAISFWQSAIVIGKAIEEARTAAHGNPIPETGFVATASIGDSATGTFQPTSANEVWLVQSLDDSSDGTALGWVLTDGTTQSAVPNTDNKGINFPLYVTKTLYLQAINGSGGTLTGKVAYLKVAM